MESLCKIDGGVRVLESVTLASSYFRENSSEVRTHSSMPTGYTDGSTFSRIGNYEYRVISTRTYIVGRKSLSDSSSESLVRLHTGIYKWPEKRLLGEEVTYFHNYSSTFSYGHPTPGASCPTTRERLLEGVFRKVANKQ